MSVANINMRSAKVEFGTSAALGFDFGYVKDVKIKITPNGMDADSQGLPIVAAYAIEASFKPMENKQNLLEDWFGLAGSAIHIKFTDRLESGNSFIFGEVIPYIDSEMDLNGKADSFLMKFTKIIAPEDLIDLLPGV